jgi:hypothetical protein
VVGQSKNSPALICSNRSPVILPLQPAFTCAIGISISFAHGQNQDNDPLVDYLIYQTIATGLELNLVAMVHASQLGALHFWFAFKLD